MAVFFLEIIVSFTISMQHNVPQKANVFSAVILIVEKIKEGIEWLDIKYVKALSFLLIYIFLLVLENSKYIGDGHITRSLFCASKLNLMTKQAFTKNLSQKSQL